MTTHTPLPWRTALWQIGERKEEQLVVIGKQDCVAYVQNTGWQDGEGNPTRDANAAFIVRACNSHTQLLEACKRIMERLEIATRYIRESADGEEPDATIDNAFELREARAAIARATQIKC